MMQCTNYGLGALTQIRGAARKKQGHRLVRGWQAGPEGMEPEGRKRKEKGMVEADVTSQDFKLFDCTLIILIIFEVNQISKFYLNSLQIQTQICI
jgi:hypothetical protein